jgi:hypothetical protein
VTNANEPSNDRTILDAIVLATASEARCIHCGETEYVLPFGEEDEPIDEAFLENYVCSECEDMKAENE